MSNDSLRDRSLHDLFRMEADGQRQVLTDGLLALERNPTAAATLEECMRAAHSLKGAARIVGLGAAVAVAHSMEDCLVDAQHGRLLLRRGIIDALLRGVDLLGRIADTPAEAAGAWAGEDGAPVLEFRAALAAALAAPASEPESATHTTPAPAAIETDPAPAEAPAEEGEERVLRIAARNLHRMLGLASEALVESRWLDPYIRSLARVKELQRRSALALDRLSERNAGLSADPSSAELLARAQADLAESQRLLGERVAALDAFDRRLAGVAHGLYDQALASHMRPFADATRGFKRMVRDLARELGKEARLEIVGSRTPVDRDVLARLEAPLGHLLRNAVDHGIEAPAQRLARGKPAEGEIRLEAHHVSGRLEIRIGDDGQGIDAERIRRAVIARGLADEDTAQRFGHDELLEFLFLPGFSLRDTVTDISGRGVGLDAVQNMAKQLHGNVRVFSQPDQGTRFQLQLPLTTSVLRALAVDIAGEAYAFPLARIVATALVSREQVRSLEGRQYFELSGREIGLVSARQVLEGGDGATAGAQLPVVVIGGAHGEHLYGLAVDRFGSVVELVVQALDPRLGKVKDIAAGALLDDGTPVLIVDTDDLLRSIERLVATGHLAQLRPQDSAAAAQRKRVLVVDDSLTVRELQRKLIETAGYAVEVAVDGMDGWNALRLGRFDLVVTDIDMPRMDGIELVELIKKDPHLRALPVMIVSYKDREEDRRRGLDAGADFYLSKAGFDEDALMQAVADLIGAPLA
ncbi:hybrid sensor histidine kinase/response regulator [Lysobacter enzymogenes]|uniref:hybrid sensor histidine kinase/response regulator n=1 Tax=Lysobacter enzymogenes TaxID=69 RepID=UPI0019D246AB|nr:hybrid sensor histidine kinase/response regulator [Lysobacter enzymogenes]MBN7135997.1 hybrid sensor histidine kinase/response regulator [Lysobacter enzymogenes]